MQFQQTHFRRLQSTLVSSKISTRTYGQRGKCFDEVSSFSKEQTKLQARSQHK